MNDLNDAGAKRLWQSQPSEIPPMSTAYLHHRANELQRAFQRRNAIEQGTAVATLISCTIVLVTTPGYWVKSSLLLLIIGMSWALLQWRRRARAGSSFASTTSVAFYIRELEHKRDLHRTLWRWYLLPMVPGAVALLAWKLFGDPGTRGTWAPWIVTVLLVLWTVGSLIYERAKAAQYQREIDALLASEPKPSARGTG
jgi:hypothetical protein